ncbi:MAG: AbrB/MazE/SpoVT family DNA-binding domain-containing protein [Methanobacteriaceae archaeon]|jgi:bifunctional DNA-binding transcriptional regulator/antitoxin component of YhaV-PrlF toxin-antitoxin module|nr:AbrB/MazE/SpoVT family DNA-binding domain-containing protein [Methanobacteriaceae archaeon]
MKKWSSDQNRGGGSIKSKKRLVYCNKRFRVTLPVNWVNRVGIKHGDYVNLQIDGNKLIVKKSD